jgi:CheY-like chemotaxis protein
MIKPQSIHILLVEDETSLGFLMKETLRLEDYSVRLCKDGEEGLSSFINERFDLCIFDVNMPKMNGFELAKHVRIKDQHIPIIFLTANNSEADKLLGFEIGADEYITKPFSTPELLARIKAVLKRSTSKPDTDLAAKDEIINIGSCGSLKHSPVTIINVGKVYEDIDIRPLCEYGYTSREGSNNYIVSDTNYTCFTTDYFVDLTHKNKYSKEYIKMIHSCDIFDMECFAIASVCNKFNIKFSSYKWVSDNGNGSDWKENCKLGLNSVINLL